MTREGADWLWQVQVQPEEEVKGFNLYLGVFDKSEITKVCNRVLPPPQDVTAEEEFERTDLEGSTCFAQLSLDPAGDLILESPAKSGPVSYVSTLPWALGQFQNNGLASLTSERFANAQQDLADLLLNFKAARKPQEGNEPGKPTSSLTNYEIVELHAILQNWARFTIPDANALGILEAVTGRKKQDRDSENTEQSAASDSAKEDSEPRAIGILNSFFIEDIETALTSIKSGRISKALKEFLSPLPTDDRMDLESARGLRAILEMLHPKHLNRGRWFSNPGRPVTLMQQFAISSILKSSADGPSLFAVNGPPGTGKTTLLQDVFADLIVRRARGLVRLDKPSDAFLPEKLQAAVNGGKTWFISVLRPELTGFELVVASSNNAAVENISGDLPKSKSLGSLFKADEYLKPVAYKIAAEKDNGSFKELSSEDLPWGLISCALGNYTNRTRFKDRLYLKVPNDQKPSWQIRDRPQTILDWIENYSGPGFEEAKSRFGEKVAEVEETCARQEALAILLTERLDSAYDRKISVARQEVEACLNEISDREREKQDLTASIEGLKKSLEVLRENERLLNRTRPGWWARLRRTPVARLFQIQVHQNAFAQIQVRKRLEESQNRNVDLHSRFTALFEKRGKAEYKLQEAEAKKKDAAQIFGDAQAEMAPQQLPGKLDDLQSERFQKSGLWHLEMLAQQRSELFAAALSLHEAWLASVGKRGAGFLPNIWAIKDLLSGRRLERSSDALAVWQSLFIIVPIVSTTFASFHNQFRDLGFGARLAIH